jgi:hypothetical protein
MITSLIAWFVAAASGLLEGEYAVECHGMTRVSKAGKIAGPSAEEPFKGVFILNEARNKAYEWADHPWEKINWCYSWDRCSVAFEADSIYLERSNHTETPAGDNPDFKVNYTKRHQVQLSRSSGQLTKTYSFTDNLSGSKVYSETRARCQRLQLLPPSPWPI